MGTYRTNKAVAVKALEIVHFYYNATSDTVEINTKPTKLTEFGSPVFNHHKWILGDLVEEIEDIGEVLDVSNFEGKPLYKIVQRDGKAYILILSLRPGAKVYAGASTGNGIYFETELSAAIDYYTISGTTLDWTDGDMVPNIKTNEMKNNTNNIDLVNNKKENENVKV